MELGDLPVVMVTIDGYFVSVAILAIMELGDLHKFAMRVCSTVKRRNPRYNGIGWFTFAAFGELPNYKHSRNPRYNGIGWFTSKSCELCR